jgi:sugar/nucleoside kinase (ribokinase family)
MTRLEDDNLLEHFKLPKGSMQLVDLRFSGHVLENTEHLERHLSSGGSAANTIHGLAKLGIETAFLGKVGDDKYGEFFRNDMSENNIHPVLQLGTAPSGRAIALVSHDAERTFATYLGAAIELTPKDLDPSIFSAYDVLYIEGYLVQNYELVRAAVEQARECGMKVALDLASYNVVEANLDFLTDIVTEYVDILFANEDEAKAFTGKNPQEALEEISEYVETVVVKIGERGSLIRYSGKDYTAGVIDVKCVDTTGAGDLYASGFLFGMAKGYSPEVCGKIGSLLAGNVIEVVGSKMDEGRWEGIYHELKMMEAGFAS